MLSSSASWVLSFLFFEVSLVLGRTLVPIHPHGPAHNRRSAEPKDLELRSVETFLWGEEGLDVPLANLTLDMPGDAENILSMERFDGMLTAVECGTDKLEITFEDDATFAYAQKVWDWVNGADNNSFVMVAGPGDCGNNENRIPYIISTLLYDEDANKATLTSKKTTWEEIAHTYDLVVGGISDQDPPNASPKLPKRDINKSTSVGFVHDLPFSVSLSAQGFSASLACTNCSTAGAFDLEFTIKQKLFIPTGASMKLKPKDVSAIAQIKLSGSGELTKALTKEFQLLQIPISALTIPGVFDLGPFLTVSVGAEISSITLSAGITTGAKASFSNDAVLEVDLLSPEKNKFSGWAPAVEPLDLKVDASINGGVAVFLKPALELQAEALGRGFSVGINMKIPNVSAKLSAIAAPAGACPATAGQPSTPFGVKASFNIGGSINFAFKKTSDGDPIFSVQLAAIDKPLASTCFPFGKPIGARSMSPAPIIRGTTRRTISA